MRVLIKNSIARFNPRLKIPNPSTSDDGTDDVPYITQIA